MPHWSDKKSFDKGMKVLKILGREKRMMDQKEMYEDLYKLTVGHLWGDIWTRPHLTIKERQLITLAANIALARPHGNVPHYNSARRVGITHEQIMETIIQVGAYGGWPCMALAVKQYGEALKEAGTTVAAVAKRPSRPAGARAKARPAASKRGRAKRAR
jgi:4-carboxymuconolactone decarboxylase